MCSLRWCWELPWLSLPRWCCCCEGGQLFHTDTAGDSNPKNNMEAERRRKWMTNMIKYDNNNHFHIESRNN